MRKYVTVFTFIGILWIVVVTISWVVIPAWHTASGSFLQLVEVAFLGVISIARDIISIIKDLRKEADDKLSSQSSSFSIGGNVTQTGDQNIIAHTLQIEQIIDHQTNIYNLNDSMGVNGDKTSVLVDKALANQVDKLAGLITVETEEHLSEYRLAWREGRKAEVFQWLNGLKTDADRWNALSKSIQAQILRFEASLELYRTRNIGKAKQLADQANALSPDDDDSRIRSIIAFHDTGPDSAIKLLESNDDIDSVNLRAAFLLELGNPEDCQQLLFESLVNKNLRPDAETHRLRALVFVMLKNINQAQVEIQKASALSPNWESIKFTKAIVDYFSSLSPIAIQSGHIYWPIPIPEDLVKADDESHSRLYNASKIFLELANSPDHSNEERLTFEIWYMACLLNDPATKEQAINVCKVLLRENPTDIRAIAWAASRRLDVNLESSRIELEKLQKDGLANIPHILALVNLYQLTRNTKGAISLLNETRLKFKEIGAEPLWYFWYTQLLISQGNPEAALEIIEENKINYELKQAKTVALHAIVEKTGDWKPLTDHLERSYQETGDPDFLLNLCKIMAHLKSWDFVADQGEELIRKVQTGEALRLAAIASFNNGRADKALELLNRYLYLFPRKTLPKDLAQLRIRCKQEIGIISEAIVDAEKNALEHPTVENLLTLIDICHQKGDRNRVVLYTRKLGLDNNLPIDISLRLSRMIYLEDRALAIALWKKSVTDLPDSLVGEAIELGFRLGLDNEVKPLMARMHELGLRGEGGIQIANLDDIKVMITKQKENFDYLNRIYSEGVAPIHIIAEQFNRTLSSLYHSVLKANEKSPDQLRQSILLIRHGGRTLISGFPRDIPKWRLNLDITAILLAEHLGILNNIENVFKPIRIPSLTVLALTQMREKATFHQPSRINNLRIVNQLIEDGKIKDTDVNTLPTQPDEIFINDLGSDWIALYQEAQAHGGYLVDFLPKKKIGEVDSPAILPAGADKVLVNCRAVIDSLRQHGPLSQTVFESAVEQLGTDGINIIDTEIPRLGSSLYCYANTIEILASTGILTTICDEFDVHIDQNEFLKIISDLKELERMEEEAEWLTQLINKINIGVDRGAYEVIPVPSDIDREDLVVKNPSLGCIITLMKFEYQEDDVIWADDRFTNSFSRRDAIPIIGINEVLKSLVSTGELSIDVYFAILNRIRASNLRFIPVQSEEILHYIQQAKLDKGQLIETQELNNLKCYIAACLYSGKILQRPPMQDGSSNQLGEVEFLLSLGHEIIGAIIELWISEEDENACLAKADWLLSNLYLDHLGMSEAVTWQRPNQDDLFLLAVSLSSFIAQAITFPTKEKGGIQNRRRKYLDWVYHQLLKTKIEANTTLLPTIVEIIKKSLFRRDDDTLKSVPKSVLMAFLQKYYDDLPETIKNEFELDSEFMNSLGYTSLIRIGELEFEPKGFLNALSVAINGNSASLNPLGSEVEIQIKQIDSVGETAITLTNLADGTSLNIQDDIFALLSNSPSIREETLLRHRAWFDCDNQTLENIISEIVSKDDPQERVELAEKWKNSSTVTFYKKLYEQLSKREPFELAIFRPVNAESLLRHHRLKMNIEGDRGFQEIIDSSAKELLEEIGVFETTMRFIGLPIPIPTSLLTAVNGLSPDEKRKYVKRCLKTVGSPIGRFHFVYLLAQLCSDKQAYCRLARRVTRKILQSDDSEYNVFFSILNWVNNDFNLWPETKVLPKQIRLFLVWAHSDRLYKIFRSLGAPHGWLTSVFYPPNQPITTDLFDRDSSLFYDVANPRQVSRPRFVLSGFQYCLGERTNDNLDEITKELFVKEVLAEIDGNLVPHISLFRDLSQATNDLGSFLGDSFDVMLIPILGEELSNLLCQEKLELLVNQAVNKLIENSNDYLSWSHLQAVLGGLRPYENIIDRLIQLFDQCQFRRLTEENIILGTLAIHTASLQILHIDDSKLRSKLQEEIIHIASVLSHKDILGRNKNLAQSTNERNDQQVYGILLDSALNISITSEQTISEFATLINRLVDISSSIIPVTRYMIQRLYDELPINQAKNLSSLLVRFRAERA